MRHGNAPLRHGTLRILAGNAGESFPHLFVLERVQQSHSPVETSGKIRAAGGREMDRADFLFCERVGMSFVAESQCTEKQECERKRKGAHGFLRKIGQL